ncbi:MAG: CAP domain-containing protein [Spirochaetaceae bacterium]|nr:MAG: CAP domain-containing protein [Spirochaetaceae bacterium]
MTEPGNQPAEGRVEGTPIRFPESASTSITERADDRDEMAQNEFARAEAEVLRLVNERRAEHELAPLIAHEELALLSRMHSTDMGSRGYYSHVDPDGVTPNERITDALSDRYYLMGTSENIAYRESSRGFDGTTDAELARLFMEGWMNSPGHRANILRPESTHIGIGLARSGNRIYATQKFMQFLVRLENVRDRDTVSAEDPLVAFTLNPGATGAELVVRVGLPDPQARWDSDGGSFYRGFGFVEPVWTDETRFTVALPVDRFGPGTYTLQFGDQGGNSTYSSAFSFGVE